MRKHFHKLLAAAITFMTVVGFYMPAQAALMGSASVELSNPKPGNSSDYIFKMKIGADHTPKAIRVDWLTAATGGAAPTGLSADSPTLHALSANLGVVGAWTTDFTKIPQGSGGYFTMTNNAQGAIVKGTEISFRLSGITNPSITQRGAGSPGCTSTDNAGTGNGNLTTGTCFVKIQTWDDTGMQDANKKDDVTVTFAVTSQITLKAKVDPSLTFVIKGVPSAATTYTTGPSNNVTLTVPTANTVSATTAATDVDPFTLDFKTLTPNAIRLLSEALTVRTNANNGYLVYGRMTQKLTGTSVNTNVIDAFNANGAATAILPQAWVSPTSTTKNSNSGFLGYNTTQHANISNIAAFADNTWAPLSDGDPVADADPTQPHTMMESTGQDDGKTATLVSFALEVNVYQPSDSYVGYFQYNVVPKY